jgi:hypothetical protein
MYTCLLHATKIKGLLELAMGEEDVEALGRRGIGGLVLVMYQFPWALLRMVLESVRPACHFVY